MACLPLGLRLVQSHAQIVATYRLFTHHATFALWYVTMFHCLLDMLFASIEWCVCAVTRSPKAPPVMKRHRRPPWRFYALGFPASWLILSAIMLPASTVVAFQTEFSIRASFRPLLPRQRLPRYETLLNDNKWSKSPPSRKSGETIPARFLHLTGYGREFAAHCKQRIHENLAAAKVNNQYSTEDFPPSPDGPNEVPSFRFAKFPVPSDDVSFHVQNYDRLDPTFIPTLLSERVCFRQVRNSDILTIVFDTGCSFAMTHDVNDFETPPIRMTGSVTTGSGTLAITGFGIVRWRVMVSDGTFDEIRVPCHLLPDSNQRLFSPQDYARFHGCATADDQYGGTATHVWITLASGKRLEANMDPRGNIPVILATHVSSTTPLAHAHSTSPCQCSTPEAPDFRADVGLFDSANLNLTQAQRALLLDHQRLGHLGFQHLQSLYRPHATHQHHRSPTTTGTALDFLDGSTAPPCCLTPVAPTCSSCPIPKCEACLLATAKRRARPHQTRVDHPTHEGLLSTDDLLPGSAVSVDQYESSVRGRLLSTRGREAERHRYSGGTIFVDHASGLVHVEHQVSLGAADTIHAKTAFERMAQTAGVAIQHYHSDNGIFTSKEFTKDLENRGQTQDLSGVGAHHQNGRAERAIQTIVWKARSMMIHQQLLWPEEFHANLWPTAMTYAAFIYNHTPRQDTGFAPIEIFTGTRMNCQYLRRCRVWGSPTYVLDPKLQDGRKIPKWRPRARRGQFLGFSPRHSSTVALVRNLNTGSISPQYHIVVDEKFETVASTRDLDLTECLTNLFRNSRENYLGDHDPEKDGPLPTLDDEWLEQEERSDPPRTRTHEPREWTPRQRAQPQPRQNQHPAPPPPAPPRRNEANDEEPDMEPQDGQGYNDEPDDEAFPLYDDEEEVMHDEDDSFQEPPPEPPPMRRGTRERRPNTRFRGDDWVNYLHWRWKPPSRDVAFFSSLDWDDPKPADGLLNHYQSLMELTADADDGTMNELLPMLFQAKVNDADSPTLREILDLPEGEERDAWIEAMYLELDQLQDKGTFVIVDRAEAGDRQIVPSTWAFKRKRYPDGSIMKLKARFCVRGDRQWEVIDSDEETHAPVVEWGTLRVILGLMLNYGMSSAQIDFRNAFVQSDLPRPIYLELPPGPFRENPALQGKILKVFKSLYGDRRAPRLWFQHLKNHLTSESFGFKASTLDHCLFLKDGVAFVVYVDDAIIISPDRGKIREVLDQLTRDGFDVKDEGNLTNYLGIKIQKLDDGSISMSQPGLIDRILETLNLQNAAPKETPVTAPLGKCSEAPEPTGTLNYRSIVGMLMYLVGNTRPDCSFATHQCARFSHAPKLPHEIAVKRIGRYLLGTRDGGIILRPSPTVKLDCYVDADFAGVWGHEDANDQASVKSRTGYYMLLGNVPVLWASKLQTEIALSTMEAEYIALSTAMRAFVPVRHVLQELVTTFKLPVDKESMISTVFEDNQPALTLATQDPPRLTPRSKHIAVKYHWFRSKLGEEIKLKYISTENQLADILTKPLPRIKFERARQQLMGW